MAFESFLLIPTSYRRDASDAAKPPRPEQDPGRADMIPAVKAYVRPDGRHFVRDPDPESLAEATTDVYCTVEASEIDSYLALGFDVHRREGTPEIGELTETDGATDE